VEDHVDWDVRIREQLQAFGHASRRLPGMIKHTDFTAQNDITSRNHAAQQESGPDAMELAKRSTLLLPATSYTQSSDPYGDDNWDVLWLGHCATSLPPHKNSSASDISPDRFMLLDDDTVSDTDPSHSSVYQPRTRIYHRSHITRCIHAYAVSQRGARKIMYEHGMRHFDKDYGSALSEWCDGMTKHMGDRPVCLTSSPSILGLSGVYEDLEETASKDTGGEGRKEGSLMKSVKAYLGEELDGEEL
jgi:hypothetical protein